MEIARMREGMGNALSVEDLSAYGNMPLFDGISENAIGHVLSCLHTTCEAYERGEVIMRYEDDPNECLYLVKGRTQLAVTDIQGRRSILAEYRPGEVMAVESFFGDRTLTKADVVAVEACTTVSLSLTRQVQAKECCMANVRRVRQNLVHAVSETNASLLKRLNIVSKRTTREKIIAYLEDEAAHFNSNTFDIPHNRQELADLLYVERSALSHELSRLQKEGIITFNRSHFELHSQNELL